MQILLMNWMFAKISKALPSKIMFVLLLVSARGLGVAYPQHGPISQILDSPHPRPPG